MTPYFGPTYRGARRYVRLPSHSNSSGADHTLGSDIYAGFLRRKAVRRVEATTYEDVVGTPWMPRRLMGWLRGVEAAVDYPTSRRIRLWIPGGSIWAVVLDAVHSSARSTSALALSQATKSG